MAYNPPKFTDYYIPAPCSADWNAMTPAEQGRHCAQCDKVVVDFTDKTEAEFGEILQGAQGRVCGRFRKKQMGSKKNARLNRIRIFAASFLLVFVFGLAACDVEPQDKQPVQDRQPNVEKQMSAGEVDLDEIMGDTILAPAALAMPSSVTLILKDEKGRPVANAEIKSQSAAVIVFSDTNGNAEIPAEYYWDTLSAKAESFEEVVFSLRSPEFPENSRQQVVMKNEICGTDFPVVLGMIEEFNPDLMEMGDVAPVEPLQTEKDIDSLNDASANENDQQK